jgi:hypothetical protein
VREHDFDLQPYVNVIVMNKRLILSVAVLHLSINEGLLSKEVVEKSYAVIKLSI